MGQEEGRREGGKEVFISNIYGLAACGQKFHLVPIFKQVSKSLKLKLGRTFSKLMPRNNNISVVLVGSRKSNIAVWGIKANVFCLAKQS